MTQKRRPAQKKAKPEDNATPLGEKARALEEARARLEAEIAQQQRLIKEAPGRAREKQRQHREQLINRPNRPEARRGRAALPDNRYAELHATVATAGRPRGLRHERRRGRLMFFVLLVTFCTVVYWLYYTVTSSLTRGRISGI